MRLVHLENDIETALGRDIAEDAVPLRSFFSRTGGCSEAVPYRVEHPSYDIDRPNLDLRSFARAELVLNWCRQTYFATHFHPLLRKEQKTPTTFIELT